MLWTKSLGMLHYFQYKCTKFPLKSKDIWLDCTYFKDILMPYVSWFFMSNAAVVNVSGHHLFADRHISYGIPPFGGFSSSRFHESSRLHHWNIRDLCFLLRIPDTSMTENIIMSSPSILVEERGDWYKSTLENDHRLCSGFEPTTFRSWERTSTSERTCCPYFPTVWFVILSVFKIGMLIFMQKVANLGWKLRDPMNIIT